MDEPRPLPRTAAAPAVAAAPAATRASVRARRAAAASPGATERRAEPASPGNPHATAAENGRFAAFAAHLEAEGFSPATRACYASDWWNVSERAHASSGRRFRLDRFGPDDFRLQRAEQTERGVAPATLNRRLAFLRRYSAFAAGADPSLRELAAAWSEVPFQAVLRKSTRALTHAQEERLRAAADASGIRDAALVALMLGTGLRAADLAGLTVSDVEWDAGAPASIRVRGERAKHVVLPPRSSERLSALLVAPATGAAPVFSAPGGTPLGEEGIAAVVERLAAGSGVEATPRTLRHTFAVRYLSEHRDDIEGLARALGQSSLAAARAYRSEANAESPSVRAYEWSAIEECGAEVRRRGFSGRRIEAERATLRPGAATAEHSHPEEQITFVLAGRIVVECEGGPVSAGPGAFVHVPGGSRHRIVAEGPRPALLLHVFGPVRRSRDGSGG